jgi:type VII secretion-associated serine protease mycosin
VKARLAGVVAVLVAVLVAAAGVPAEAATGRPAAGGPVRAVPLPDTGVNGQWWFTSWQIPKVWATGARGQGVTVAVVDSGVQASRPELRGVVLPGTDFHGGDGRTDHSRQVDGDDNGHGTTMAMLIAAQGGPSGLVGIAPRAKILPVVRQKNVRDVGTSIRWAVDHGAKVINMSYVIVGDCYEWDQSGVRYALEHGAVIVAGAGNSPAVSERGFTRPANCPGVIPVGAIDHRLQVWALSARGAFLGVAAPGVNMPTVNLDGEKGTSNGTSDAAALTSGAIALVWSKYPHLTNRQVVARLLATARDLGAPGKDDLYGYGGIRPYQAITTDVPADAPNPIFDRLPAASPAPAASPSPTGSPAPAGSPSPNVADAPRRSPTIAGISVLTLLLLGGGLAVVVVVVLLVVVLASRRSSRRRAAR